MKPTTTTPGDPSWSRAKGLLKDLNSAARNSVAAQILLGKELDHIRKKLGFTHGGDRKGSSPQRAVLIGSPRTWKEWCQEELGISDDTANRYVACFGYALDRAKAQKSKDPEAFRLLATHAAVLTGDELELLAVHVGCLVKPDRADESPLTQSQILEELGIKKPSRALTGGDTSASQKPRPVTSADLAVVLFPAITRGLDAVRKTISNVRYCSDYRMILEELDLDSPEDEKPSLMGIKNSLEEVLKGDLPQILKDIEDAIKLRRPKEAMELAKSSRKKSLTTSRK